MCDENTWQEHGIMLFYITDINTIKNISFSNFYCFFFYRLLDINHSSVSKESACNAGDPSSIPGSGRRKWQPTPIFLPVVHGVARVGHDLVINSPPRYYYFEIHTH